MALFSRKNVLDFDTLQYFSVGAFIRVGGDDGAGNMLVNFTM